MITIAQYFGDKPRTMAQEKTAAAMLEQVNELLYLASQSSAYDYPENPNTHSCISGSKGGSGDGGFRLPDSKTGAKNSKHKLACAVDVYDPARILAQWCVKNKDKLFEIGLFCEDFRWTPTWVHLQNIQPASRKVIFIPSNTPPLAPALEGQTPLPFKVKT